MRRTAFPMAAFLIAAVVVSAARASVTKVGNGDDGADLEALKLIRSGPIWEARERAVETLRKLNAAGVAGLGSLLPEVERADLLMASQDAHPTGEPEGAFEVSDDRGLVYARTFPEPYAATRFFPAALRLSPDQLVALHIHEALHRSLAASVRTNEDAVMHLTMAMTSPGASFDRVRQTARLYLTELPASDASLLPAGATTASFAEASRPPSAPSPTTVAYNLNFYDQSKLTIEGPRRLHGLEFKTGFLGVKRLGPFDVEPMIRGRLKIVDTGGTDAYAFLGPASGDVLARVRIDERSVWGPFVRFTTQSLDSSVYLPGDRDVFTVGAFYEADQDRAYFASSLTWSPPSSAQAGARTTDYKSILSAYGRAGFKFGRFLAGTIAELHSSEGNESSGGEEGWWEPSSAGSYTRVRRAITPPIRILTAGPEIGYKAGRYEARAFVRWFMNDTPASLTALGDVVDRGMGRANAGGSISAEF